MHWLHIILYVLQLTHLSFVDDLMIFTAAQEQSLQGIKEVLQDFYSMSGPEGKLYKE